MLKSYITLALRNIRRNPTYTFLNILGLSLGIAACLVIFLVVRNELTFDNYKKADRIYRVTHNSVDFNSNVSLAVAPALRTDFPDLTVTRVMYSDKVMVKVGERRFRDKDFMFADDDFPEIFDLQWLSGDPKTALSEPNTIVINETLAKKYFGDHDAMGQIIDIENQLKAKVTGVIKDIPNNRSLPFQMICSMSSIQKQVDSQSKEYFNIGGGYFTFIMLPPHVSIQSIQARTPAFLRKNWNLNPKEVHMPLQPLKDIHFDQRYINNVIAPTSKGTYFALFGVGLLIIITACINFINLATAQAIKRAREVGVRKVLGARREQLVRQFLGETTVLVLVALVVGVALAALFLSRAEDWLGIQLPAAELTQPIVTLWIAGITVAVIIIAGLYPAFVQSAFQPVESLKSQAVQNGRGITLRKGLVIAQFAITQILIVGTLVVARQMDYFENQDLGFNKESVVAFYVPDMKKNDVLKQDLIDIPGVEKVTFSSGAPTYSNQFADLAAPDRGLTKEEVTEVKEVDENYLPMFGIKLLAGQTIAKRAEKDTLHNVLVNETLIHKLNYTDPQKAIGQRIIYNGRHATISGVLQDFQSESKHKVRRPCVIVYDPQGFFMASIKIKAGAINSTLASLNKVWANLYPDNLPDFQFLDEHIATFYQQEQKEYTAFKWFSAIAIIIGCLGLYGLVMFAASQRTKEIGIRKVLGAPLANIVGLFSKEFVLLITIAFVIAAPVAYYMMNNWLANYAYHIHLGPWIFIVSILASMLIAGITIAHQTFKAVMANPVKSLRSE